MQRNVTAFDLDPYRMLYFNSPNVAVEFYKDRNFRSKYEIMFSIYHKGPPTVQRSNVEKTTLELSFSGNSPTCQKESHIRCGPSNTSICIDEGLTCDKFPHCPDESDEEHCGPMSKWLRAMG